MATGSQMYVHNRTWLVIMYISFKKTSQMINIAEEQNEYDKGPLATIEMLYKYILPIVAVFGIVTNIINVLVFTKFG